MSDPAATDPAGRSPIPPPRAADDGPRRARSLRLDLASAYLVTAARVGAWATVSALVYRRLGRDAFAMLALVRSTVGLLAYTSIGLAPAMVRALAEADWPAAPIPPDGGAAASPRGATAALGAETPAALVAPVLSYATAKSSVAAHAATSRVYASGVAVALGSAAVATPLSILYGLNVTHLHTVPAAQREGTIVAALSFGLGMVARLMSEAPSSLLQVRGRIAADNLLLAGAEAIWVAGAVVLTFRGWGLGGVGISFLVASLSLSLARGTLAHPLVSGFAAGGQRWADGPTVRRLLAFGLAVAMGQAADYLYAPTDFILINRLIGPGTVAVYAPAVQIDSGLLLIVTGLAGVLLPHSALAHAAGDRAAVRRYYVRGTLAGLGLLAPAAMAVWLASPLLLRLWLGSPLPETRAILPLVLVSTVIGGSSAVGRSILLAMGKVKPFTASVLVAGATNVLLSFAFVRFFGWGLRGIILGTVVAVVGRCAVWMPWYVLRALRESEPRAQVTPGNAPIG